MIPYFLLLLVPLVMTCITFQEKNGRQYLLIRKKFQFNDSGLAMQAFFFILVLLLVLRAPSIGRDLSNYRIMWNRDASRTLQDIWQEWDEPLFKTYNYLTRRITDEYQLYLVITALITVLPIAYVYCQDKRHGFVKIALFVNMSTFVMLFSGLRQSIAIALGVVGFELIKRKKNLAFFVVAFLAALIHTSGFMVFALFPLYHVRFEKKHLLILVPVMGALFVFNRYVFLFLTGIFSSVYEGSIEITSTGARGALVLFILFAILSYVITDEKQMSDEDIALRNILLATVAMQSFASLHTLAMRMNYYFIIFIPLAVGKCFSVVNKKYRSVAIAAEIVLCVYFTVNFCMDTYQSYITGSSALDTIPYIPFWME